MLGWRLVSGPAISVARVGLPGRDARLSRLRSRACVLQGSLSHDLLPDLSSEAASLSTHWCTGGEVMKGYEQVIGELIRSKDVVEIREVEDLMRLQSGGTLGRFSKAELGELARVAVAALKEISQ